jgi:hypothetical protein
MTRALAASQGPAGELVHWVVPGAVMRYVRRQPVRFTQRHDVVVRTETLVEKRGARTDIRQNEGRNSH